MRAMDAINNREIVNDAREGYIHSKHIYFFKKIQIQILAAEYFHVRHLQIRRFRGRTTFVYYDDPSSHSTFKADAGELYNDMVVYV